MTTAVPDRAEGRYAAAALLSLEDARARMLDGITPLPTEAVALDAGLGRVLAEPIHSRLTLPPWDNSAMDGFAVRASDVSAARASDPVVLRVAGEAAAGRAANVEVLPGTAIRILTGAPMPIGADTVVPVEETDARDGLSEAPEMVAVLSAAAPGSHIRRAGSDLRAGYPLLAATEVLSPAALAVAAAGGWAELPVHRAPRIAVLATGDELARPGATLGPDQIPDSNSVGLAAQAREAGAEVRLLGIARDNLEDVLRRLHDGLAWADVIVVSGGVSVGAHDVVKEAFSSIGRIEFWRVAVQPGKPLAFGRAPADGRDGQVLLFGLPGNPVSSFVTFELFVRPLVRRLAGHSDLVGRAVETCVLDEPVSKSVGRRAFLRVNLVPSPDGRPRARLAGGQGSHVLSALAAADGLAVIPEEDDALPAGAEVTVIRLR